MKVSRLLLLLVLPGCESEPASPLDAAAIDALPDEVARLRALEHAAYSGVWDLDALEATCNALQDHAVAEACRRYLGRPHLFRGAALRAEDGEPGAEPPPCRPSCEGVASRLECVAQGSVQDPAGAGCGCLSQPLAQNECWFRVAEGLRAAGSSGRAAAATAACLEAGALKGPCLHHQAEYLGSRCAPTDGEGLASWRSLSDQAAELEAAVAHWDAFERERLIEVVWAGALRCAFQYPAGFDPGLVPVLPTAAVPHLRAALAWHVVADRRGTAPDLEAWGQMLAAWESSGVSPVGPGEPVELPAGPGPGGGHDSAARCLDLPGGCRHASLRYFAMGKRLHGSDPSADRRLCLLEAAARIHPQADALVAGARGDSDPAVADAARGLTGWPSSRYEVSGTAGNHAEPGPR